MRALSRLRGISKVDIEHETVADALHRAVLSRNVMHKKDTLDFLTAWFADIFEYQNPNFNRSEFYKWSGAHECTPNPRKGT